MPVVLYRNSSLSDTASNNQTSTVGETSLANAGSRVFFSGNWYASKSLNSGSSWSFVDPYSTLPAADGGFCCDQTIIYEQSRDLLIWILQYVTKDGTNTLRIAVQKNPTLNNSDWYWWDFQPQGVNSDWSGEWFDYNHAATSNNFLYVGSNVFNATTDVFTRAVLFRFPLDALASGTGLSYSYYSTSDNFSLRCVQGARDVMHFGSHNNVNQLRVFSWPENASSISQNDVNVSRWSSNPTYSASGPDGNNWLSRCDPRITGAWLANGVMGFAWSANSINSRPFPHVRVVRINESTKSLVDEPDIWSRNYAFAYPALAPNARGDVGISLFRGGNTIHPGHVVGVRTAAGNSWNLQATRNGSNGPNDSKWGDYLDICQYSDSGNSWYASGFTLQGGGNRTNIEPRVVRFGYRES